MLEEDGRLNAWELWYCLKNLKGSGMERIGKQIFFKKEGHIEIKLKIQ